MNTARTHIDIDPHKVRRILVCQLRQIGDVLLSTPAIGLLRQRFPQAQIHLLTEQKALPVVEGNTDIARVWTVDKKAQSHLGKEIGFYLGVARQRFDLIVDFQQLPRIRWVVAFSRFFQPAGGQVRLSYDAPWYNRWLYTHFATPKDGYAAMSKASVLEPLGITWNGELPTLTLTDGELAEADSVLAAHGVTPGDVLVTVDPSHRRSTRRWPARYWGELAAEAAHKDNRLKFLILYGPGERPLAEEVHARAQELGKGDAVILPANMFSIRLMSACIQRATLHFGNCSAPRHIAVGVGTPTFIILGSTSGAWTSPSDMHEDMALGMDCQPCNDNTCRLVSEGDAPCLVDLTPATVLPQFMARIQRYAPQPAPKTGDTA